eukprot:9468685-Pyramimonas_sp.AAC.1
MDQSDAGRAGTFSRWTNQTQEGRECSHDGPIRICVNARAPHGGAEKVRGPSQLRGHRQQRLSWAGKHSKQ